MEKLDWDIELKEFDATEEVCIERALSLLSTRTSRCYTKNGKIQKLSNLVSVKLLSVGNRWC